jgi:hypothetical protein
MLLARNSVQFVITDGFPQRLGVNVANNECEVNQDIIKMLQVKEKMISTSLINHINFNNNKMSIVTSANITDKQKEFLENNSINFSKLVRKHLDSLMEKTK